MNPESFRFVPEQASSVASEVDLLYYCLIAFSGVLILGIGGCILYFSVRYRRKPGEIPTPAPVRGALRLELIWTMTPLVIALGLFGWSASIFVKEQTPPPDAMDVYVVGKQWMWKIQHPEGKREINELHLPLGRPVRLILTSMDVIHDFYVPAFRTKKDALPGTYTQEWFTPTKVGQYHFFCSQYCGTEHSRMIGWVYVMEPARYAEWLSSNTPDVPVAEAGAAVFHKFACDTCHSQRGPTLAGVYRSKVKLSDGTEVIADDNYLRNSILQPSAQLVAGYTTLMPAYKGILSEEQVIQLVEYIKSLRDAKQPERIEAKP